MILRIAFAGTPDVAIPSLDALLAAGHDVVAVITRPDAPAGRGRVLMPSPVAHFAAAHGLRVFKPTHVAEIEHELRGLRLDCIPVVAYGGMIPRQLLDVPTHGWINLHFSLLPRWRGAAPVQRAIMAGDDVTGATVFRIDAGLDTGPVYATLTRPIAVNDTAGSLLESLASEGAALLAQTVSTIEAALPTPQPVDGVTHAAKLGKVDARVAWGDAAVVIDRHIRGCTPEPGAWTEHAGERIVLGPVSLRPDHATLAAGEIEFGTDVLVGTGSCAVALGVVKPAGRNWMDAEAWMRGVRERSVRFDAH